MDQALVDTLTVVEPGVGLSDSGIYGESMGVGRVVVSVPNLDVGVVGASET